MSLSSPRWSTIALGVLGVAGITSATLGLAGSIPIEGVTIGATAVASAVAGIVARTSVISWADTRLRESDVVRRQHREDVYEAYASHLVGRFTLKDWDHDEVGALRAKISVWAGKDTLRLAAKWNAFTYSVGPRADGGPVFLSLDQQLVGKNIVGEVVLAMRRDLGEPKDEQPTLADVVGSIFDA